MALDSLFTAHRSRLALGILKRAALRCWGRDVMLYTGGVSFFALLALFPALTLLIGFYSLFFTPAEASAQAQTLAHLMPASARALVEQQLQRLATTPARAISAQSVLVLVVGGYAAHRGFKALLAGLTFIHDEEEPLGFLKFNLLAFFVAVATFVLATVISGVIIAARVVRTVAVTRTGDHLAWFDNQYLWAGIGLMIGASLLYRYAMSHSGRVIWRASVAGGVAASFMTLIFSFASAFYVDQIVQLGATYGSVATVIIFLIWLSWNVNAVFFGGALATEVEIFLDAYHARRRKGFDDPKVTLSSPGRAFRR